MSTLSVEGEAPSTSTLGVATDSGKLAPKQKIRIKLRSYWVPLIEDSCKQIMDAARTTNAETMGPVPLQQRKESTVFSNLHMSTKIPGSISKSELINALSTFSIQLSKQSTH